MMNQKGGVLKRARGLVIQLLGLVIIPMLLLILFVAYGSLSLHDHEMRLLVSERDTRAARAAGEILADRFVQRQLLLKVLVETISEGVQIPHLLTESPELKGIFDGGLILLNREGQVVDTWQVGIPWSVDVSRDSRPWVLDHEQRAPLVIVNATQAGGAFKLFGGMSLNSLNIPGTLGVMQNNLFTQVYLVADDGHILYAPQEALVGTSITALPHIDQAVRKDDNPGEQGADDLQNPDMVIVTTRIDQLNWTLIIQEPWSVVINPSLRLSLVAPLAAIPAGLLAAVVIGFGLMRIVLPMHRLSQAATKLAWGDYAAIAAPVGGIQEIRDLQFSLSTMAQRVRRVQLGMHSYIGAMLQGQEDERKRLSRELHDDTLQALIALDQRRQMAQKHLERDPGKTAEQLSAIQTMLEQGIVRLRGLIRDMRPSYLEDLGLVPALETLCQQLWEQGPTVTFEVVGKVRRLLPEQELALYRITQEAITNAGKHAAATKIGVKLDYTSGIRLEISDNGRGFAVPERPDTFAQEGHYGLVGIVERAEQIGARFTIRSKPGSGTWIEVTRT